MTTTPHPAEQRPAEPPLPATTAAQRDAAVDASETPPSAPLAAEPADTSPPAAPDSSAPDPVALGASEPPAAAAPDWAAQLAGENHLPPHLRRELAAALAQSADNTGALPLTALLAVLRETLPPALGVANGPLATPAHPAGEAFFRGHDEASDEAADQIARAQLARCGLLKQPA